MSEPFADEPGSHEGVRLLLEAGSDGLLATVDVVEGVRVRVIADRRRMSVADALNLAERTAKLYQRRGFRVGGFRQITQIRAADLAGAFEKIDQLINAGSNFVAADPVSGELSGEYRAPAEGLHHLDLLRQHLTALLPPVG